MTKKMLFLMEGNEEDARRSIARTVQDASNGEIRPVFLWLNTRFRKHSRKTYASESCAKDILKKYPISKEAMVASRRSLRCEQIADVTEVARINLVDTPHVPIDKLVKQSIRYMYASKKFLVEEKIDFAFFICGRGLFQRALGVMARALGLQTIYVNDTLFRGNYLDIWNNELEYTKELKNISLPLLTEAQKQEVLVYFKQESEAKNLTYPVSLFDRSFPKKICSFFRVLKESVFAGEGMYGNKNVFALAKDETKKILKKKIFRLYYDKTPLEQVGKYIFYPLQFDKELQLILFWPDYSDQGYLVQEYVDALPDGYKLIIKEHPHHTGELPLKIVKKWSKDNRVLLVPADTNVHDIVKNSSAVVLGGMGTTGLLSLMYQKPTICMDSTYYKDWRIFYADYGITFNVKTTADLPEIFKKAVNAEVDADRTESFFYHVVLELKKGNILCPVDYEQILACDKEHIKILADWIVKKIK